jgi:hypothetical protein
MDGNRKIQEEAGPYIWLRYATQYVHDGRTHTVEMSVPVPVGTSPEARAQLIREAEEGMQQLVTHMDQRASPTLVTSSQTLAGSKATQSTPQPAATTRSAPMQPSAAPRNIAPGNRPAGVSAPHASTQPAEGQVVTPAEPPTGRGRPSGGLPLPSSEPGSNMPLPQFIQYIKDNMDLTPKQAMEILNVRSLTTGINLRDALELIKEKVGQSGPGVTSLQAPTHREGDTLTRSEYTLHGEDLPRAQPSGPLPRIPRSEDNNPVIEIRSRHASAGFDEEVSSDGLSEPASPDGNYEDLEDLPLPDEFSEQELERARLKVGTLRESQGATLTSPQRLQVLSNVVLSQISEEELRTLIGGVWNIQTPKKLKVDQAEALISWAKLEDDFMKQVEAILEVLEGEHYARGNR